MAAMHSGRPQPNPAHVNVDISRVDGSRSEYTGTRFRRSSMCVSANWVAALCEAQRSGVKPCCVAGLLMHLFSGAGDVEIFAICVLKEATGLLVSRKS